MPRPPGSTGRRSGRLFERDAFVERQAAPHAVALVAQDGRLEAGRRHRAGGADRLGPLLALEAVPLALATERWVEVDPCRIAARGAELPVRVLRDHEGHRRNRPRADQRSPAAVYTGFTVPEHAAHETPDAGGCQSRVRRSRWSRAAPSSGSTSSVTPSIETTRTCSPTATGVARLVRARHLASRTLTTPSGSTASITSPSSPIIHSRPIVGVANRVRTIEGMPTTNVSSTPPMPASSVIHDGRSDAPGRGSNSHQLAMTVPTVPTAVHKRGTPTCTSTANASIEATISPTAQARAGSAARPVHARTNDVAPTTPAMPTPAV